MPKNRVLYIEDEPSLGRIVHDTLEIQGYEVKWERDGSKVIAVFKNFQPDICVVDIMLPGIDGYSLCRTIKGLYNNMPVIFLTARTETADLVKGFEAGGTDYIKKPFSIEELIARIENQIKLHGGSDEHNNLQTILTIGSFTVDTIRFELQSSSGTIKLSNRDMQIMLILYANRNGITSRKDLLMAVWGDDSYFNSRTLDVYIRKLRRFFASDPAVQIITLKSNGYLFMAS